MEPRAHHPVPGLVLGKSNDYILVKTPEFEFCQRSLLLIPGGFLHFFSEDLANNVKMGQEVIKILLKKRLALKGRLENKQRDLTMHASKIETTINRYQLLQEKLDVERQREISGLEEDRMMDLKSQKDLEIRLMEVEKKLEQYRIENFEHNRYRWALDTQLYQENKVFF